MNDIKLVEPVDFKALATEHLQKTWFLDELKKLSESKENKFNELITLCEQAKDNGFYTISGIILDVVKSKYSNDYQLYLTR